MVLNPGHHFRRLVARAFVGLCLIGATAGEAADFRMVTGLYVDGRGEPVAENLTLFVGDMVYDFSLPAMKSRVTILDTRTYDFQLLNVESRVQCDEVRKDYLEELIARIQTSAKSLPALPRFAAKPTFEISYDETRQRLVLESEQLTYEVVAQRPGDAEVSRQFRDFADWYARLNAPLLGALPPGARLSLNTEMRRHDLVPQEIERRIPSRQESIVSRHEYTWTISKADQRLIDQANSFLKEFRTVSLPEYRRLRVAGQPAAPKR